MHYRFTPILRRLRNQSVMQGRSSDLFRLRRLPGFHQWLRLSIPHVPVSGQELTAAGTVADFHGIPF